MKSLYLKSKITEFLCILQVFLCTESLCRMFICLRLLFCGSIFIECTCGWWPGLRCQSFQVFLDCGVQHLLVRRCSQQNSAWQRDVKASAGGPLTWRQGVCRRPSDVTSRRLPAALWRDVKASVGGPLTSPRVNSAIESIVGGGRLCFVSALEVK